MVAFSFSSYLAFAGGISQQELIEIRENILRTSFTIASVNDALDQVNVPAKGTVEYKLIANSTKIFYEKLSNLSLFSSKEEHYLLENFPQAYYEYKTLEIWLSDAYLPEALQITHNIRIWAKANNIITLENLIAQARYEILISNGKFEQAIFELEKIYPQLEEEPLNPYNYNLYKNEVPYFIGRAHLLNKNYKTSRKFCSTAINRIPVEESYAKVNAILCKGISESRLALAQEAQSTLQNAISMSLAVDYDYGLHIANYELARLHIRERNDLDKGLMFNREAEKHISDYTSKSYQQFNVLENFAYAYLKTNLVEAKKHIDALKRLQPQLPTIPELNQQILELEAKYFFASDEASIAYLKLTELLASLRLEMSASSNQNSDYLQLYLDEKSAENQIILQNKQQEIAIHKNKNRLYFTIILSLTTLTLLSSISFWIRSIYQNKKRKRDSLTTLLFRRNFIEMGARISNSSEEISRIIAIIKIQNMAMINVKIGQKEGDALLKNIGRVINNFCTKDSLAGRLGGATFALITEEKNIHEFENLKIELKKTFAANHLLEDLYSNEILSVLTERIIDKNDLDKQVAVMEYRMEQTWMTSPSQIWN